MKFIAHKGNVTGSDPTQENKIEYIKHAVEQGHGVEFDVRSFNGKLYLGHDEPQEELPLELLRFPDSFVHAKDIDAFETLLKLNCNVFWHQTDKVTITNKGFVWCYPGIFVQSNLAVWLDLQDKSLPNVVNNIYGICGDYYNESIF